MDLNTYLTESGETAKSFAKRIGAPASDVSDWRHNKRSIPHWRCKKIEDATGGMVDRKTTCPEFWHQYWPELIELDESEAVQQENVA